MKTNLISCSDNLDVSARGAAEAVEPPCLVATRSV